jgi:Glycosyl hydrolase family 26
MRRGPVLASALVSAIALVGTVASSQGSAQAAAGAVTAAAVDPNQPTLIWGGTARPRSGETNIKAVQNLEVTAGRNMAATRVYLLWDAAFPDSYHTWLADTGRMPLISVFAKRSNGTPVLWRDIANAAPGSTLYNQVVAWANKIKAYNVPVCFTFNHEPEAAASDAFGTDQDFIAAWRKVVTTFRNRGVTNAKYLWVMTDFSYQVGAADDRQAVKWYPGDAYVDAIGSDQYNDFTCRLESDAPWKPLTTEFEYFRKFGLAHPTKEMWLPEYGTFEDPDVAGRKAQWFNDARAGLKSDLYSQLRGIVYFHSYRPGTPCEWWLDSSASSMAAWKAMGQDVFFSRTGGDPPPPPPPPGKTALLVVGETTLGVGDTAVRNRLVAGGYDVTVVDDSVAAATDAAGKDLVVVTSTSVDTQVKTRLKGVTAPVLIWKPTLYDDMGLTAAGASGALTKQTSINIVQPASPLAAGRSGTVVMLTSADSMPWGDVGPAAQVVAQVGGKSTLFSYSAGAALASGGTAAGCRVGFPAYHTSPARFTADGWAIFDAATSWLDACS